MITRRKRPTNLSRQQKNPSVLIPQFKSKQSLGPFDLSADFQFTTKLNIKLKDVQIRVLFQDLYPYFTVYSVTMLYVILIVVEFIWCEFNSEELRIRKLLDQQNSGIAYFWARLTSTFVYLTFIMIFGSYLQKVYKLWYFIALFIIHFVSFLVFQIKGIGFSTEGHIYTAVYSIYWLVLVEKKMQCLNLTEMSMKIKALPFWEKIYSLGKKQQDKKPSADIIDFSFTERPLSIKGGQTDDSFSYDSFFSYSDPFDLTQPQKGFFQSNISKRSSHISHHPEPKKPAQSYYAKFTTQKSLLQQGQIQSTIASSEAIRKEKQEQELQLVKIYKCFILSFLVYSTGTKAEWIGYLVAGCVLLGCVEVLTNEKLKFVKFGCFLFLAVFVVAWM